MQEYDVIVVGGGAMGTAAAYHLARDGQRVLLLEQYELGHNRGSTHGDSRIIRLSYEWPEYVRLAQRAYELWAELEQDAGEQLLTLTGGLDLGPPDSPLLRGCIDSLAAEGVAHEVLDSAEVRRRFPQFQPDDDWAGLYQADAGILPPTRCLLTMARRAQAHGATVRDRTPVQRISPTGDGVELQTASEILRARRLVVTAGPWARSLLRQTDLDLPLQVELQQVVFFAPPNRQPFMPGALPVFIAYETQPVYGLPIYGQQGVKVAEHHGGPNIRLDQYTQRVDPAGIARLERWLARHLPGALGPVVEASTCLYTNTPDGHFVVDQHPTYPQIAIGAGFSGHGFKFAIVIGRLLADLAQDRRLPGEARLFKLARLSQALV